jgi:hypothetical protein
MQISIQTPSGVKIQGTTESIKQVHTQGNRHDLCMFVMMSFVM